MRVSHWMEVAALASALGVTGAAIAQDADTTTSTGDAITAATGEPPAAGAIVMPEDRAMLNNDDAQARDRSGTFNDDASTSNDDRLSVNPGPSRDDMSVNPRGTNDEMTVDPARVDQDRDAIGQHTTDSARMIDRGAARLDENGATPATRSDSQPSDMGPGSVRGE